MPQDFTPRSGWTAASLIPDMNLHSSVVSSLSPGSPTPASGPMVSLSNDVIEHSQPSPAPSGTPALPTGGFTAKDLMTTPQQLNDPTLGSRGYMSVPKNFADVAAQTSVYQTPDIPGWLNQTLANLNAQQDVRSQLYQSILGPLYSAQADYLKQIGSGFSDLTSAEAKKAQAQTSAIQAAQDTQRQINELKAKRAAIGEAPSFAYLGSQQQALDTQIAQMEAQNTASSATQRLAQSAAGSGWVGSLTVPGIPAPPMI